MSNILPSLKLRSRLKNTASCNSKCCNDENNSNSYRICERCGSKVDLANLRNAEYDIRHNAITKGKPEIRQIESSLR